VNKSRNISLFILGFIIVCLLLYITGVVTIGMEELIGYSFIIIGLALFYSGYQSSVSLQTFFGSAFFLTGILFFIISGFPIVHRDNLLLPTSGLIIGISFLMVFFQNNKFILAFVLGIISILIGLYDVIFNSAFNFSRFMNSVTNTATSFWPIVIIFVLVILLIGRDK